MKITQMAIDFSQRTNLPESLDREAAFWDREFAGMKAAGIDSVLIRRSAEYVMFYNGNGFGATGASRWRATTAPGAAHKGAS